MKGISYACTTPVQCLFNFAQSCTKNRLPLTFSPVLGYEQNKGTDQSAPHFGVMGKSDNPENRRQFGIGRDKGDE
ncbi:hypothetical protein [Sphingobacterium tabacisoli]|uniref:Uncharacterized protein n=1 Tax=Sphingobacterium tabacisoli TaxID=2044855 RepID=A0ABW5L0G4_9SPHI|nr:hypothetical protein [Sphingobacterium tabacisoli]